MANSEPDSDLPNHVQSLIENISEVNNLIILHASIIGGKRGRPPDIQVLSKSAVVLLVACWEAYVEDLASNAFEFLLDHAGTYDKFPNRVLAAASKELRESPDPRKAWQLAGDGWRSVLVRHKKALFKRYIGRLNTPRASNIDSLFKDLIGISNLSSVWKWRGVTNASALAKLDRLVTLRGEIAHRVKTSRSVQRRYVERSGGFVNRLASTSSNAVREHIIGRTGVEPWIAVTYGETG